jgi:hypothetical protein
MSARDLIRLAERDGWSITTTNGGHLRLEHPDATGPVFTGSTPSDRRAIHNALATMRRALPPEPKPAPAAPRPKRRSKPKPKPRQIRDAIDWQAPPDPPEPHGVGGSAPRAPRRPLPGGPSGYVMTRWP